MTIEEAILKHQQTNLIAGGIALLLVVLLSVLMLRTRGSAKGPGKGTDISANLPGNAGSIKATNIPLQWVGIALCIVLFIVMVIRRPHIGAEKVGRRITEKMDESGGVKERIIETDVEKGAVGFSQTTDWATGLSDSLNQLDKVLQRLAKAPAVVNADEQELRETVRDLSNRIAETAVHRWEMWTALEQEADANVISLLEKRDVVEATAELNRWKQIREKLHSYLKSSIVEGGNAESREASEFGKTLPKFGAGNISELKAGIERIEAAERKAKGE